MDDIGLDVRVEQRGTVYTAYLRGELDIVSMARFQAHMRHLLTETPEGSTVLLDASELHYIDSVGIGQLVAAWKLVESDGHALAIIRPHHLVRRILELTGLMFLVDDERA